jgi:hypothetical protein
LLNPDSFGADELQCTRIRGRKGKRHLIHVKRVEGTILSPPPVRAWVLHAVQTQVVDKVRQRHYELLHAHLRIVIAAAPSQAMPGHEPLHPACGGLESSVGTVMCTHASPHFCAEYAGGELQTARSFLTAPRDGLSLCGRKLSPPPALQWNEVVDTPASSSLATPPNILDLATARGVVGNGPPNLLFNLLAEFFAKPPFDSRTILAMWDVKLLRRLPPAKRRGAGIR